jgi:hypothetical protein
MFGFASKTRCPANSPTSSVKWPAGQVVVGSMSRGSVHRSGALVERDVIRQDADRGAVVERVPKPDALEARTLHPRKRRIEGAPDRPPYLLSQVLGDEHCPPVKFVRAVDVLWVERDREVRRDRPRRRRPDQDGDVATSELGDARRQFLLA